MTIEAVRNNVNLNLANWKRTNTQTGKKKTVEDIIRGFIRALPTAFRFKKDGKKIKYKQKTIDSYISLLDCYCLGETQTDEVIQILTTPFNIDGSS